MNYDSDEIIIKKALSNIKTPKYDISSEVIENINKRKSNMGFKRVVSIGLVVCLCLMLSVGVMAATIPSFRSLIYKIGPEIELMFQPIEISSEDNGIKMEVVAAMNDDEMAVIYLTMQDLTGNRIDETLDIYDYSLTGARTFNCQIVHYDEKTKTATLRMEANGGKKLNGKKVSFHVSSFFGDKITFDEVETGINLLAIKTKDDSQTIPLDMENISGAGGDLLEEFEAQKIIKVLKTDELNISLPDINFVHISNIGYIDGRLHIQTKWTRDNIDDHGYLYLVDSSGKKITPSNVYFGMDESGNTKYGDDYIEYIFDVGNIDINKAELKGYFVSNNKYTTGNWKTTFKMESVNKEKQTKCNIKFDKWIANSISISPMGVTLSGNGEYKDSQNINISANMTDGSVQTFESVRSYSEDGKVKLKYTSSLPLDVLKVKSININGTVIDFD